MRLFLSNLSLTYLHLHCFIIGHIWLIVPVYWYYLKNTLTYSMPKLMVIISLNTGIAIALPY